MSKSKAFTDPEADMRWAEAVDKVMTDAAAKENLMGAEIPEFGIMRDLRKSQIEEMAARMKRAALFRQMRLDTLKAELARREAAEMA